MIKAKNTTNYYEEGSYEKVLLRDAPHLSPQSLAWRYVECHQGALKNLKRLDFYNHG